MMSKEIWHFVRDGNTGEWKLDGIPAGAVVGLLVNSVVFLVS